MRTKYRSNCWEDTFYKHTILLCWAHFFVAYTCSSSLLNSCHTIVHLSLISVYINLLILCTTSTYTFSIGFPLPYIRAEQLGLKSQASWDGQVGASNLIGERARAHSRGSPLLPHQQLLLYSMQLIR
jgi:hypothetical protein